MNSPSSINNNEPLKHSAANDPSSSSRGDANTIVSDNSLSSVCCKRYKKYCPGQKDHKLVCSKQTRPIDVQLRISFLFPTQFLLYRNNSPFLFVSGFPTSFETTGFLPPLHTSLGRILDQTEMVDGNNLEIEILIMLNLKQLN